MENHPIPQDVTGFQFKLIGNMTVKQFGYLATGIVLAWAIYQMPINFFIKFPFCAFFALLGTGLAYYPINGRPMDVMIGNYFKAFFHPTEFIYDKTGGKIYFPNKTQVVITKNVKQYSNGSQIPTDKLRAYLETLDNKQTSKVDEKEKNFLLSVSGLTTGQSTQKPTPAPDHTVYIQRIDKTARQLSPDDALQLQRISHLYTPQIEINPSKKPSDERKTTAVVRPAPTTPAVTPVVTEQPTKSKMPENQISWGQIKTAKPTPRGHNKTAKLSNSPDFPNLITGTTKDSRGNALSNILIEVRDKDGNPVRAFKTNGVGRFASATPLASGTYTVEFEDPKAQNKFEKITVNITNKIVPPIEAISTDTREELRRSLFAHN